MENGATYTVFWLYKAQSNWRRTLERVFSGDETEAHREFATVLANNAHVVTLRAAYSTVGFRADVDMILWLVSQDPDALQSLAVDLKRTSLGQSLDMRTAALIEGIDRVATAKLSRGLFP
jgi:hydrogen peroxide-dependent heme synthase